MALRGLSDCFQCWQGELRRPHLTPFSLIFTITIDSAHSPAHLHGQMGISGLQRHTTGGTCRASTTTPLHLSLASISAQSSGCTQPRSLPLRLWGWPRGARLGFPRGREGILEKLLPMASGPRRFCSHWAQARLGRSGGKMCASVCARECAPPGEGPGGAAAGGGRASPLLPLSGFCGPRRVLPAAGVLARAGYLSPIPRGGDGGRGRAPGSGPAAPGTPLFLPLMLGFGLVVGGAAAWAHSPWAIESGLRTRVLSGSACQVA